MSNTSIVICGKKFDIGTRVVLWDEPNGFNAYDTSATTISYQDRKTGKMIKQTVSGKRYGMRSLLNPNPTINQLKKTITQFFLHHSGNLLADSVFETLHKERKLSCHFILDDHSSSKNPDGVLYQTLDLREKAFHGGSNNSISIGIEICSRASASKFPDDYDEYHQQKYHVLPRRKRIDVVQGMTVLGYEYNDLQYNALVKLGHILGEVFPNLKNADFPRTQSGRVIKSILQKPLNHIGFINHYNTSIDKWDPVCLDHERFLAGVKNGNDVGSTFMVFDNIGKKQMALSKLKYYSGKIDGDWGPKSKQALLDFQKDNKLKVDGVWGQITDYYMDIILKERKV